MNFQRLQRAKHHRETAQSGFDSMQKRTLSHARPICFFFSPFFTAANPRIIFYPPVFLSFALLASALIKALIACWQEIMETIFIVDFWLFSNLLQRTHKISLRISVGSVFYLAVFFIVSGLILPPVFRLSKTQWQMPMNRMQAIKATMWTWTRCFTFIKRSVQKLRTWRIWDARTLLSHSEQRDFLRKILSIEKL